MRAARAYSDPAAVSRLTKELIANSDTVFQIHRLAETQGEHVGALLDYFNPPTGAHILDVGCGVGGVAQLMARARPDLRFTLLNNSAEQLDLCPPEFDTVCSDFHAIALPDTSVDAILICYALGHSDIDELLTECARVTRDYLYVYDLTSTDSQRLMAAMDYEAYSADAILKAADRAGFTLERLSFPEDTHVEHFYDKMDAKTFAHVFSGVRPALFRFSKSEEIS